MYKKISVSIQYEAHVDHLVKKYNDFDFLNNQKNPENDNFRWSRGGAYTYDWQVIFLGKTGYGKSSTINSIVGKDVLKTDDVKSCTKELQSVEFKLNGDNNSYLSFGDLPGVGESIEVDKTYLNMYKSFLSKSHVIVYVLRADQRDLSIDEDVFKQLFSNKEEKEKVIIGLNYIDKIEPLNRKMPFSPSEPQIANINKKINEISKQFGVYKNSIIGYSAKEGYNLGLLVNKIAENFKKSVRNMYYGM